MKKYIIINYYSDNNFERKKELLYCVQKNLNLSFISKVIVFFDKHEDINDLKNLINYKKLVFVDTKKKLLFKNIIYYCQKNLPKNSILIIINLDIFLANNKYWKFIDRDFFKKGYFKKALVCHRVNLHQKKMSKINIENDKLSIKEGDFADAWIMSTPIDNNFVNEDLNFTLFGSPGADPLVMGIMTKYYHVFHWGKRYKIYHYDIVRKNNDLIPKHFHLVRINPRTDPTALMRINEAVKIPINQDWKVLLKKKRKPVFIYIKKRGEFFLITLLRKIYIYIVINYKKILFKIK
jgi:hypothetical protein